MVAEEAPVCLGQWHQVELMFMHMSMSWRMSELSGYYVKLK